MFKVKFNFLGHVFGHMAPVGMHIHWQSGTGYEFGRKYSKNKNQLLPAKSPYCAQSFWLNFRVIIFNCSEIPPVFMSLKKVLLTFFTYCHKKSEASRVMNPGVIVLKNLQFLKSTLEGCSKSESINIDL